jgi:hypothetical protein
MLAAIPGCWRRLSKRPGNAIQREWPPFIRVLYPSFIKPSGCCSTAWCRAPSGSLVQSTFWSIITITPLLMWIARSFSAGAVSMLPNVLPIVMVFGGMGWLGIDVDVGSMMTASIALGVAVDDTIHYLNWFRAELDRVGDRNEAILAAYKHCATPTLQAAVISGLGLSIFAMSTFTPTQAFGILMLVILWLGAIAELIYFPALLAGPLGRVFKPRTLATTESTAQNQHAQPLPRQPQLQILRVDEAADRLRIAMVSSDGENSLEHSPHGKTGQPRLVRHDEPRGRPGGSADQGRLSLRPPVRKSPL